MFKAYKYALLPTPAQQEQLQRFFGCCRFVYNLGLETKLTAWVQAKKHLTCLDLANQMKELKDTDATWLSECPSQALQMSLRNLDKAYTSFFKGGGFPRFKNRYSKQSIQFPQGVRVDFENSTIFLPKLKNVSVILHRKFEGQIKTVTVSKTKTGKYLVSILVENQESIPARKPITEETAVGVDIGVKTFATLSDGASLQNIRTLRTNLKRLRVEQRTLHRRFRKGAKAQSRNYYKQKQVIARLHESITQNVKESLITWGPEPRDEFDFVLNHSMW